jgi:hypothetical protein
MITAIAIAITTRPNMEDFFIYGLFPVTKVYKSTKRTGNNVYCQRYMLFRINLNTTG